MSLDEKSTVSQKNFLLECIKVEYGVGIQIRKAMRLQHELKKNQLPSSDCPAFKRVVCSTDRIMRI